MIKRLELSHNIVGEFMQSIYKKKVRLISTIIKFVAVIILIYIQIEVCKMQWNGSNNNIRYLSLTVEVVKLILLLHIVYKLQSPSYKLLWLIIVMIFPIPAGILYIVFGNTKIPVSLQKKEDEEYKETEKYLNFDNKIYDEIRSKDKIRYNQIKYLSQTTGLPVYRNSKIEYFDTGEKYFESLLKDMSKAKNYILMEYFSISEGTLWNSILNILRQKSSEGVKIYIITDDMINSEKYPKNFKRNLEEAGIEYRLFNPLTIMINRYINYRNHRKIVVIDGSIAYTGGLNVGDEYINVHLKFGHWKDTGVKTEGESVLSYILIFLRTWNVCNENKKLDYKNFIDNKLKDDEIGKGYIMPYYDGPDNTSNPAQNLYIQMINTAKDYIYITTPYLVLDDNLVTALVNSAKSGIDIRIITPFIPDKPLVHLVTRSFYQILLESGVKIYEYKPGFIHSKIVVSDDELAVVGSINLDFRGLYFHYECGNYIYKTGTETIIREDFINTQKKCIEIRLDDWKKRGVAKKVSDKLLITLAPMI